MLDEDAPVAYWKKARQQQQKMTDWITSRDQVTLIGSNMNLKMSVKERLFIPCDG
jgi:leucyl aminopeptidase (aminopeptidase T)